MNPPFDYDPLTGVLLWKHRPDVPNKINARFAGKPAGHVDPEGYDLVYHDWRVAKP